MIDFETQAKTFDCDIWFVNNNSDIAALQGLTDSATECQRLQSLLDNTASSRQTYPLSLLARDFNTLPIEYPSRYADRFSHPLLYGGKELKTALAESAMYMHLFYEGPIKKGPLSVIRAQRSVFRVKFENSMLIDLCSVGFDLIEDELIKATEWSFSQKVGARLAEQGVDLFFSPSVRYKSGSTCCLLNGDAMIDATVVEEQSWQVYVDDKRCNYGRYTESFDFDKTNFADRNGDITHCLIQHLNLT